MAKKKNQKPIWYFNETWKMNFYLFIGWTFEDFCNYMAEFYKYTPEGHPRIRGQMIPLEYFDKDKPKSGMFLWVKDKKDYPTLAHEALHAANRTLDQIGWKPCLWNDEPQAYLMTNIIEKALEA